MPTGLRVWQKSGGVNGLIILMTKSPGHLEIAVGNKTQRHSFTLGDRDQLNTRMLGLLRTKQFDEALLQGVQFIKDTMQPAPANEPAENASGSGGYIPPVGGSSTGTGGFPVGGMVCVGVVILFVVVIIIGMANRNRGYGGGYGAPPPGGYPPGYSGGYQQGGGFFGGGGGGSGFGSGLLGGLLGGALGSWGYDRFSRPGTPNYTPPTGGPATGGDFSSSSDQTDTSFSGTGGDFGGGGSSGGDFGSSSDSSSSGSDFGSSGGDFGGGGGDSGGGSGGDF